MKKFLRTVFSKYTFCALSILLDFALIIFVIYRITSYSYVLYVASQLFNVLVVMSLILRNSNPEFKVSWLVVVMLVPFFGSALYVMFYSPGMSRKDARAHLKAREDIQRITDDGGLSFGSLDNLDELSRADASAAGRAASILKGDGMASVYKNTAVDYYPSGEELYAAMLEAIGSAKETVFLEYFIIAEGKMWDGIYKLLRDRARGGVDVRILYDDVGSMGRLPKELSQEGIGADGISCYPFSRITPIPNPVHNNRDHRKLCIVDGSIAFTGGVNIADEYINEKSRFGHWKDSGVRIRGDAVHGFTKMFVEHFAVSSGGNCDTGCLYRLPDSPPEPSLGFFIPFSDGPLPVSPSYVSKTAIMNMINRAERYVYITTPYLVIDYDLTEALREAGRRGVDVRIITPGIPDKKTVKVMTKSSYPRLMEEGVRIFEYTPGFIHEKMFVSDDTTGIVGSINLDYRSLVHHFEDGLWIYGSEVVSVLRDSFLSTCNLSREIKKEDARLTPKEKLVRALVGCFAPLL